MADNMINLAGNLPPEIASQQAELTRRQQLANLLTQQGTQQIPTGSMVSGRFVPTSPFQYLAQYGNIAAGNYLAGKASEESQKTAQALRDYYKQEAMDFAKELKTDPEAAYIKYSTAYNPAIAKTATERLTRGEKWEKIEKLDDRGNTVTYMMDVNSPKPESTLRMVGVSKPAISPAEAARLRDEGIGYGGGPSVAPAPVMNAPAGGSPVIRNNAPVSVAPNAPSYAQGSLTMSPTSANVPITPTISMAGISPKEQRGLRTEQFKKTQENVNNAHEIYKVAGEIKSLLPQAHGSGFGAGMGYLANMFDIESPQNVVDEQLKVLSSRILMQVPRFQGPQSDKDVATYKEAAGSLADPTKSIASRQAALQTIINMNKQYAPELDWNFGIKPTPVPTQNKPQSSKPAPAGVDPRIWNAMTPQEQALWK